jgi:hypothetical protein
MKPQYFLLTKSLQQGHSIYENPAEYPAIYGGDECGAGVRGMQSPSLPFIMPRFLKRGSLLDLIGLSTSKRTA